MFENDRLPSKLLEESVAADPAANNWIVHCALQKALPFEVAFDRLKAMPFRYDGKESSVECFGLEDFEDDSGAAKVKGSQIRLIDIVSDNEFIIELVSTAPRDRLILGLIPPLETLAATIDAVEQRLVARRDLPSISRFSSWHDLQGPSHRPEHLQEIRRANRTR